MQYIDVEKLEIEVEEKKDPLYNNFDEKQTQIRFLHYRKSTSEISRTFSAPPGVNPFHLAATKVRKFATGNSKLVFIWPQKASNHDRIPSLLVPIFRAVLIGMISLDMMHIWPGEFMPNCLPLTLPLDEPLPPMKCNVIEPRWSDNN